MSEEEQRKAALQLLRSIPGNGSCADCDTADPDWASLNLGVLICMECSGVHRSLGVHISKVRSTTLDKIDPFLLHYFQTVGNTNSNAIWEAALSGQKARSKPDPTASRAMREMWIKAKYQLKSFLAKDMEKDQERLNAGLFAAIENDSPLDVLKMLAWGANPGWKNMAQEGRTALHQAVMYGDLVCVECIAQHSIELGQAEIRGWTPLHYAAYQDDPQLVELLMLRGGTSLSLLKDNDGLTPLDIAVAHNPDKAGGPESRSLLEAAVAKAKAREQR